MSSSRKAPTSSITGSHGPALLSIRLVRCHLECEVSVFVGGVKAACHVLMQTSCRHYSDIMQTAASLPRGGWEFHFGVDIVVFHSTALLILLRDHGCTRELVQQTRIEYCTREQAQQTRMSTLTWVPAMKSQQVLIALGAKITMGAGMSPMTTTEASPSSRSCSNGNGRFMLLGNRCQPLHKIQHHRSGRET